MNKRREGVRRSRVVIVATFAALLILAGSTTSSDSAPASQPSSEGKARTRPVRRADVWYKYDVVNTYPHDRTAFTQGLVWHERRLYEGTGLRGASSVRRVRLETGEVERKIDLAPNLFGEGIVVWSDSVFQITWQNQIGFVYDLDTFAQRRSFTYQGEGWGLTHDGRRLIMSNGSSLLTFRDPETFAETGQVRVTFRGAPVERLNELEYIKGQVWANIWPTNQIARIEPTTGNVSGILDLTGILTPEDQGNAAVDVLNGIAYDDEKDRVFVTGKLWPKLYEIRVR